MLHVLSASLVAACMCAAPGTPLPWNEMAEPAGSVKTMEFGKLPDGTPIEMYVLSNGRITAKVITYGAILTELDVPDRHGKAADVVLGFDDLSGYLAPHPYFGAIVGRVANRVAAGKFTLDGHSYTLAKNNGPNTLHGGLKGFDKAVWKAEPATSTEGPSVKLSHTSPDGDEGYPGNLKVTVIYTLTDKEELKIQYAATTDKPTPVNLTNHSYFNLSGPASGDILGHEVTVEADQYTPVDAGFIPTGKLAPVAGTPFDFTKPTTVGSRIKQLTGEPIGYDLNYALRGDGKTPRRAAVVHDPRSGRVLEAFTTEPGIQLYTGNFLDGTLKGKQGVVYNQHQAFCLEAQHFPDSVNQPDFPSTILRPGQTYSQTTIYKFSVR